jgi:hypothetical protein
MTSGSYKLGIRKYKHREDSKPWRCTQYDVYYRESKRIESLRRLKHIRIGRNFILSSYLPPIDENCEGLRDVIKKVELLRGEMTYIEKIVNLLFEHMLIRNHNDEDIDFDLDVFEHVSRDRRKAFTM